MINGEIYIGYFLQNSKKQPDSEVGVSAKNSVQPDSFHGHNNSDSLEAPAESTLPSKTADPFPEVVIISIVNSLFVDYILICCVLKCAKNG